MDRGAAVWWRAGRGAWARVVAAFALCLGAAVAAGAHDEPAEWRIGRTYWAQPPLSERSVEFYADVDLRERRPVYDKMRLRVEDIVTGKGFPHPDPIYRVRFADNREAFIAVAEFERQLYRELRANEVAVAPNFEPPLGRGIQVHLFERSSLFEADPDVIWSRVKDQGPRRFTPALGVGTAAPRPEAAGSRPVDPSQPILRPR